MNLSVVIPSYNGRELLAQNLPAVIATHPDEIIIVDDGSTDDTVDFLKHYFPRVILLALPHNQGFVTAVNRGVAQAQGDIVVLFNNDVSPHPDCLSPLARHFQDPQLFSVGFLEHSSLGQRGKSRGFWHQGLVQHAPALDLKLGDTLWTFAASAAYRKSMWHKLGGLDRLFRPAYWEDLDLSYRAHKAGLKVIFDPACQVEHEAESTMKSILGNKMASISYKNQLLFVWKNITSLKLIISHLIWLPYHLARNPIAFFLALVQLPEALISRFKHPPYTVSDETIL